MPDVENGRKLKTVETAIEILDQLKGTTGRTSGQIAEEQGLAKSTVHGYLSTLETYNYVYKEDSIYQIGGELLSVGGCVRQREPSYQLAIDKVGEISKHTEERAQFLIAEGGRGITIHTSKGSRAVQVDARIGKQSYMHASSAGKAILAHSSDEYVEYVFEQHGLPQLTENTITSNGDLLNELATIRDRGFAFNCEESISGLNAVGVPIMKNDTIVGAISVSGPSHRLTGEEFKTDVPNYLRGAINELELRISYESQIQTR